MTDFAAIFRHHWPDVQRFSLYLCGNRAEAEDLASEAFLRAWMSTKPIRTGTVKSYLFVIVRNLYRDRLRKGTHGGMVDGDVSDPRPGPETSAADQDELDRVLAAMQRLSEDDRAILAMAGFASMPHELIGAALELSVGAVKVRVHRARLRLNLALEEARSRREP